MRVVTGNLPGFTPTRFPKMGRTGNFRPAEHWRKRLSSHFCQEIAMANTENLLSKLGAIRKDLLVQYKHVYVKGAMGPDQDQIKLLREFA
jgi:hypothetical protein